MDLLGHGLGDAVNRLKVGEGGVGDPLGGAEKGKRGLLPGRANPVNPVGRMVGLLFLALGRGAAVGKAVGLVRRALK